MTARTTATTIPLVAGTCRDCGAPVVWTLRAGKKVALDAKPIEVIRYDRSLVDTAVLRADLERVLTDAGQTLSGWKVPPTVRPDLARVAGRTAHWGNCWPDDPFARQARATKRERLDEQRGVAGVDRRVE